MNRLLISFAIVAMLGSSAHAQSEIDLAFVGEDEAPAHLGARQGLTEANAQGEFLGLRYALFALGENSATPRAIIAALDANRLDELSSRFSNTPIFNIIATDTSLREACAKNVFHVIPSRLMIADAERQWRSHNPESKAKAQTWHPTFRKYAAAQLNARYHEQFKRDMNDEAWAGWAAVKLLSDMLARDPSLSGNLLIEELTTNLAFDGQKGIDMSFRETGQLRQPLLLVDDGNIVAEAPVRGVVKTTALDSLGLQYCPK